jgi:hypothetical protein
MCQSGGTLHVWQRGDNRCRPCVEPPLDCWLRARFDAIIETRAWTVFK